MSETKEYISNITLPNGDTKYIKDSDLTTRTNIVENALTNLETDLDNEITNRTQAISEIQNSLNTTITNVSTNTVQIKTNQENILTNSTKIGENSADLKTAKSDIATAKSDIATAKSDIATLKTNVDEMIDKIYPVGSIYLAMNSTNPSSLFGGTWERIKDRFLLACGDSYTSIGTYGGEETHTLTIDEMPAHTHTANQWNLYGNNYGDTYNTPTGTGNWYNQSHITTDSTGGGKSHNNMPPYVTCYIWQRTA